MFCPECGAENPDNAKFCIKCRYALQKITPLKDTPKPDTLDIEKTIDTTKLGLGALAHKRYKIIEERGRGGMGIVYKAYDSEPPKRQYRNFFLKSVKELQQEYVLPIL